MGNESDISLILASIGATPSSSHRESAGYSRDELGLLQHILPQIARDPSGVRICSILVRGRSRSVAPGYSVSAMSNSAVGPSASLQGPLLGTTGAMTKSDDAKEFVSLPPSALSDGSSHSG